MQRGGEGAAPACSREGILREGSDKAEQEMADNGGFYDGKHLFELLSSSCFCSSEDQEVCMMKVLHSF